jgi:hypothetical protein
VLCPCVYVLSLTRDLELRASPRPLLEYQELLARANTRATPEIVARLERNNPGFVCAETDESFWKLAVGKH